MSSDDDPFMPTVFQRTVACFLLGLFSGTGLLSTLFVLRHYFKKLRQLTPFNIICATRCLLNLIVLVAYSIYQFPQAMIGWTDPSVSRNACITGLMANIYVAMEYISCMMAVNRFVAIVSWKWYLRIFSRGIVLIVLFLFILERGHSVYKIAYYQFTGENPCSLVFDGGYIIWMNDGECEPVGENAADWTFIFMAIVAAVNLLTFLRLLILYNKSIVQSSIDIKANAILFVQTICQDLLFVIDMLFMTKMYSLIDSPLWYFVCFEFTGLLVHALDSWFLVLFQPDIRKATKKAQIVRVTRASTHTNFG